MTIDGAGEAHVRVDGTSPSSVRDIVWSRPVRAVLVLLSLISFVELVPALARFRVVGKRPSRESASVPLAPSVSFVGEAALTTESVDDGKRDPSVLRARGPFLDSTPAVDVKAVEEEKPPIPLLDPSEHALDGFYRSLIRTAAKQAGAVTRITQFGDSIVVSDYVSGTLRRKFQTAFGDAGHGFMLIANAWPAYTHNDVFRYSSPGWNVSRIVGPITLDGYYGLGGVSFKAPPGVRAKFGTAKQGDFGRKASRFVISYLEQPGGGHFRVDVDGKPHAEVDTAGDTARSRFYEVRVPDGEHEFEIVTRSLTTRMFGTVLERDVPGIVLDAVGVQGARIRFLDKIDDAHFAEQLKWRSPNLVVFQFGANESGDGFAYPMPEYYATMKAVLEQTRKALPEAGCLIIGAMDRARQEGDAIQSMRIIPLIVQEQERASKDVGCAFFNTFKAMGGAGSMPSWVRRGLGQADLTHPTGVGSEVLATWIFRALMDGYNSYLMRQKQHSDQK